MAGSLIYEIRYSLGTVVNEWYDVSDQVMYATWKVGFDEPYQIMGHENTANLRLKNTDGRWNPETAGTLQRALMQANNRVRIRAVHSGGTVIHWRGRAEQWDFDFTDALGENFGAPVAVINCYSNSVRLKAIKVDYASATNVPTGTVIEDVCDLAGVVNAALDTSTRTMPITGDGDFTAWGLLEEATKYEYGRLYISGRDQIEWWNRHHTIYAGTVTPAGTLISGDHEILAGIPGKKVQSGMNYVHAGLYANKFRIEFEPRFSSGTAIQVWQLDEPIIIPARGTINLYATLRKEDGEYVSSGSVTVTGATFSYGTATVTATAFGGRARLTLANVDPNLSARLTAATLTGIASQRLHKMTYQRNDAGVGELPREWSESLPIESWNAVEQIGNWEAMRRGNGESLMYMLPMVDNIDDNSADHHFIWDIGTLVQVRMEAIGHNRKYIIIGREHFVTGARGPLNTYLYTEPVAQEYWDPELGVVQRDFFIWDQTNWDEAVWTL